MESQPQNPEFRNNPENFHPSNCSKASFKKATADVSRKARGLHFGLSLYLHPYFLYVSSQRSGNLHRLT